MNHIYMTERERLVYAFSRISDFIQNHGFKGCHVHKWERSDFDQFQFPELIRDNHGNILFPGELYVIVTCENDHRYYVNITGLSVLSACAEVLNFIQYK
jgi:hypothetical protein